MDSSSRQTPERGTVDTKFFIDAMQQFQRFNARMDDFQERLTRRENAERPTPPRREERQRQPRQYDDKRRISRPSNNVARPQNSSWEQNWRKEWTPPNKPTEPVNKKEDLAANSKGKAVATLPTQQRNRDFKCFKCQGAGHMARECPNQRAMIMRGGEIVTDDEEEEDDDMPALENASDEALEYPVEGEALITQRVLSIQPGDEIDLIQRENIFHSRCFIDKKVCGLIIDGGSCANLASAYLVKKLGLSTVKHPSPYQLHWLNDSGAAKVQKQVLVSFSIGRYRDEVLCDVVPMFATHLLLGRPWQFDRKTSYDGFTNRYSFEKDGKPITLVPLTPRQVHEDRTQLHKEKEEKKNESSNRGEREREAEKSRKITGYKERGKEKELAWSGDVKKALYLGTILNSNNPITFSTPTTELQAFENDLFGDTTDGVPIPRGIDFQPDYAPDSRSNPFEEEGNDTISTKAGTESDQPNQGINDPTGKAGGPMTSSSVKPLFEVQVP